VETKPIPLKLAKAAHLEQFPLLHSKMKEMEKRLALLGVLGVDMPPIMTPIGYPIDDGHVKGQGAMITTIGGKAYFTFHEIGDSDSNGTITTGAAFF